MFVYFQVFLAEEMYISGIKLSEPSVNHSEYQIQSSRDACSHVQHWEQFHTVDGVVRVSGNISTVVA